MANRNQIMEVINSGISLIPIANGKKTPHPVLGKHHDLLTRRATSEEVDEWVEAGVKSFAVAGGKVSGNLVTLDFDEKHREGLYEDWYKKLSKNHQAIVDTFQKNSTRNKGTHLRYRTYTSQPTIKLARKTEWCAEENREIIVTIAETRGEGSYALIPPSNGYKNLQGDIKKLPLIPDDIHEDLIDMLRTFNEVEDLPEPSYEWKPANGFSSDRPGDRLNHLSSWEEVLEPHGWKKDGKNYWVRPGKNKKDGISATTDYEGIPMLYVFSTSAAPFEANRGYSKFHAYTLLNHNGDFKEAAKAAAKLYPQEQDAIDTNKFKEMSIDEVCKILSATIKKDETNKSIAFLSMLNTYTDDAQMNIFFNAPSSTGKSHIPLSVVDLFPKEDQMLLGHCSPTAFFHEQGTADKEKNEIVVNLSRKILIFTDMPNTGLLERLRSILSHDTKESVLKITDKNQKGGNRTKTVRIIGYPSVYFCSAGLRIDEQESTRFIMLSPSIEHDKVMQGIKQSIAKESDKEKFLSRINSDPKRQLLKERIIALKHEKILDVKIANQELVEKLFMENKKGVLPRDQRDVKKIISLIKGYTLLNLWFRKREGGYVLATDEDIENGFKLWREVSYGQEYGLAPYVMSIYTKVILPAWEESDIFTKGERNPITRKEILDKYFKVFNKPLSITYLRQHILPQLESVGLILQERSSLDGREMVVIPLETNLTEIVLPEVKVEL